MPLPKNLPSEKYFLGIHHGHNATVAVLDMYGQFVECISEERFCGVKNYTGFPKKSVDYVLEKYGRKNIAGVGILPKYLNPSFLTDSSSVTQVDKQKIIDGLFGFARKVLLFFGRGVHDRGYALYNVFVGSRVARRQQKFTSDYLKIPLSMITVYDHHLCHAYPAYYLSPYNNQDALVLTLDGEGDGKCATVNMVKDGVFSLVSKTSLSNSLGLIYKDITQYLGMKPNEHEYKVMGLAAYAKPEYVDKVYAKIQDWIVVEGMHFKSKFDAHFALKEMEKTLRGFRFDNIAGAFQRLVEERVSQWVKNCIDSTGLTTVCCGGGVFMNVKANMEVARLPEVKNLWVMPSGGDESTAFGAALGAFEKYCLENGLDFKPQPLGPLYLGPAFSNEGIKTFLSKKGFSKKYVVSKAENIEEEIAQLLSKGEIVAHLSGRMEWGARALGNRSILANPSDISVIKRLNEYVKSRDFWMPFAASILAEREKDYICNPKNVSGDYMVLAFESCDLAKKELIAGLHQYDLSIRPQIVQKSWNPRYHRIISEFEKLTGIGGVLNTSFNLHGLPIVLGPKEAIYVFENSALKYMVLEDYLISKKG